MYMEALQCRRRWQLTIIELLSIVSVVVVVVVFNVADDCF